MNACLQAEGAMILTETLPGGCELVELRVIGDERGSLLAIEGGRQAPFEIARAYCLIETRADVVRGLHAHKNLRQLAVAVSGACTMILDDGRRREEVRLDRPTRGVLMGPMVWREMRDFTADCVLLVLADSVYDEQDYIRDYDAFLREVGNID